MPCSVSFLRSVLRLMPRIWAARTWLPPRLAQHRPQERLLHEADDEVVEVGARLLAEAAHALHELALDDVLQRWRPRPPRRPPTRGRWAGARAGSRRWWPSPSRAGRRSPARARCPASRSRPGDRAHRERPRARPARPAYLARKCSTSSGMSRRRSRSGGRLQGHHVQPVVEILPEPPLLHERLEIAVGGGQHADVDADRTPDRPPARWSAPAARAGACVCRSTRHVADLVEEEGAAMRQLELAEPALLGVGEGAALVAEQLGFEEGAGNGRARDGDERSARAPAVVMDGARHQLLARARLAAQEHGDVAGRPRARWSCRRPACADGAR